jgi:radical SAM protein with 4Fe4S-binding SPASM domain
MVIRFLRDRRRFFQATLSVILSKAKQWLCSCKRGRCFLFRHVQKKNYLFTSVEIETTSICNRKCSYCPNSTNMRPEKYIDEKLFYKIIDELAELKFSGRFSPHFYGEPLLDGRLVSLLSYVRQKLPKVFIKVFTNGDLLTEKLFHQLISAGVDVVRISQHGQAPAPGLEELLAKLDEKMKRSRIEYLVYHDKQETMPLMNRGGLVQVSQHRQTFCDYVNTLVVDVAGNVILCCQDFLSQYSFGNLREQGVAEIWHNRSYKAMRDSAGCGIWNADICFKCNGISHEA